LQKKEGITKSLRNFKLARNCYGIVIARHSKFAEELQIFKELQIAKENCKFLRNGKIQKEVKMAQE
jgi:exosome complex RNA-binding protein Csl4